MIQDIDSHKMHNEFKPDAQAGPEDLVMAWNGKAFLARADFEGQTLEYPRFAEFKKVSPQELVYLFSIDEDRYFLLRCRKSAEPKDLLHAPGCEAFYTLADLRRSRLEPRLNVFAAFTAYHLADWYDANRFIKHPSEVLSVGDIVDVVVLDVDPAKKRISLSIKHAK